MVMCRMRHKAERLESRSKHLGLVEEDLDAVLGCLHSLAREDCMPCLGSCRSLAARFHIQAVDSTQLILETVDVDGQVCPLEKSRSLTDGAVLLRTEQRDCPVQSAARRIDCTTWRVVGSSNEERCQSALSIMITEQLSQT